MPHAAKLAIDALETLAEEGREGWLQLAKYIEISHHKDEIIDWLYDIVEEKI